MSDFNVLLQKAKKFHGDVCPGIVIGTRMAMAGMRELGMEPSVRNRDLIVYVEIDRCAADAIQAITGCSLGHRTLKAMNYGKFAATFVDIATGKAVRVSVLQRSGPGPSAKKDAIKNLSCIPEPELLRITKVSMNIPEEDLPGMPKHRATCSVCGEQVLDSKEVSVAGKPVCRSCATGPYYTILKD